MHLNHYENPYSRLAQHMNCADANLALPRSVQAMPMTSDQYILWTLCKMIFKGLASYCKAETTFAFHFSILTLSNALLGINNREIKIESGISFAIASQPFRFPNTLDCL